ncbi:hypothetical protein KCV03_g9039, partial [Aureobasidium melanogenum]
MRSIFAFSALAMLAAAIPTPQEIDIELVNDTPDPTYTIDVGVTAQAVSYTDQAAQVSSVVSSVSVAISDVLSGTAVATIAKRSACATQPTGVASYAPTGTGTTNDNPSSFLANTAFQAAATNAPIPPGYDNTFTNLQSSNNAYGYMGFTTLNTYDTNLCASKCNAINGCMAFNIYFERDPSVDPGTGASGCSNPASVAMIKCVFWGGPVTSANANNNGQYRNQFQVVIAGSNGYVNKSIEVPPGFSFTADLGSSTINAPYDVQGYNTFITSTLFHSGPFDASLCATFCQDQTAYNVQHPASDGSPPKICNFFATYLLYDNNTSHYQGQYCSLYTEAWSNSYATNNGYYYGSDHYQIDHSYTYTNASSPGFDPLKVGDKNGAVHQASVDITYATLQTYCSSILSYTTPVVTVTVTATSTPVTTVNSATTVVVTSTSTSYNIPGARKRQATSDYSVVTLRLLPSPVEGKIFDTDDAITSVSTIYPSSTANAKKRDVSTPNVLTKYPSTVVTSACSLVATPVTSTSTSTTTITATGSVSTSVVGSAATSTTIIVATATSCPANALANKVMQGTELCACSYTESCGRFTNPGQIFDFGMQPDYLTCLNLCDSYADCAGFSFGVSTDCQLFASNDGGDVKPGSMGDGNEGWVSAASSNCQNSACLYDGTSG